MPDLGDILKYRVQRVGGRVDEVPAIVVRGDPATPDLCIFAFDYQQPPGAVSRPRDSGLEFVREAPQSANPDPWTWDVL